jgi:HEAT repeat protein
MGFRDFINSRWYRRLIERDFERFQNIKPPAKPSRRYIDKLVKRLINERKASHALKELSMMGAAVVPSLAAALGDPRFLQAKWPKSSQDSPPLDSVLGLLVPHGAEHVLAAAMPLIESPSHVQRKTAAVHLASLGRVETIPALARLLQDEDGYVRSYVSIGIHRAVTGGRADEEFRRKAYDLLLAQCDQRWKGPLNDAAETVVALDPQRAAVDFASERWLSNANDNAHHILDACNRASILLPESVTRPLLDHALRLAVGDRCYPHEYVAAEALESLALRLGEQARPLLEAALHHEQERIQEAAALGIVRLAGLEDPVSVVLDRVNDVGFDGLSHPQRVVYCASLFDDEVCNGGIMQFFGNSSGDHAADTLDALRELGHPEAEAALALAMKHVGPLAREPDREMRLAAFEGRYEQLKAVFDPLESAYYQTGGRLRQKMLLYAVDHADHFRT